MSNKKNPPRSPFTKGGGYLDHAEILAAKINPHAVSPNPRVGCVVVKTSNNKLQTTKKEIVGEGVHEKFGGEHAEVNALKGLDNLDNCEVYITLEPCDTFSGKKTPSCTDLLIQKKPKKIIIGNLDPRFKGKNLEKIRNAGIEVEVQDNEKCDSLNPFLEKFITTNLPYVTLKLAQSLDGKITSKSKYISNELSRKKVHERRAQYSAILTTTETVFQDDPRLDCRLDGSSNPDLIVVGERKIPKTAKIFGIPDREIHFFKTHDLEEVLKECGKKGIDSIMTECGATVATELLQKNLVDEIQLFIAPEIFGQGKNVFCADLSSNFKKFELNEIQKLGNDLWMRFKF